MPDLLPCPSCQAMLRVPPAALKIRCPQCKTIVDVSAAAPIPVAKPLPPAVPLPFGTPQPKPQAEPLPVAKPLPIEKPVVRGKIVRDDDPPQPKKKPGKDLKAERQYEEMAQLCKAARIGVRLLGIGAALSAVSTLAYSGFLISIAMASTIIPALLWLAILALGLRSLVFVAGYIGCLFGPKGMRSTAGIGIGVTLIHSGLLIPLMIFGFAQMFRTYGGGGMAADTAIIRIVFILSSMMNNLNCLTDFPWMFIRGEIDLDDRVYFFMMVGGACLEFLMMAILGTLVHFYASEGKGHELGFRSLKFVYRIIWVVMIVGIVKVLILVVMLKFAGEQTTTQWFRIPHTLTTVGFFLWWSFAWYQQYQSMNETLEVITPSRFLDQRLYVESL